MVWKLREYVGLIWLAEPLVFDTWEELQDHMTEQAAGLDQDQEEAYYANSTIEEVEYAGKN